MTSTATETLDRSTVLPDVRPTPERPRRAARPDPAPRPKRRTRPPAGGRGRTTRPASRVAGPQALVGPNGIVTWTAVATDHPDAAID